MKKVLGASFLTLLLCIPAPARAEECRGSLSEEEKLDKILTLLEGQNEVEGDSADVAGTLRDIVIVLDFLEVLRCGVAETAANPKQEVRVKLASGEVGTFTAGEVIQKGDVVMVARRGILSTTTTVRRPHSICTPKQ